MVKYIVILIFLNVFTANSQVVKSVGAKDLKVGLVLSGGGAKGLAHIGVLKVLDEAGVRVDYIGGTSMGAIIGALYASGYTGKQIDSLAMSFDFEKLMQDELPRRSKSIYQKENTEKYALTLPVKNKELALPLAVSKGQNVANLLSKLMEHVHTVSDFSKLPIPFYCIATNLETGKAEVLEKGYLPEAVRASGAFPTLLDPVNIDGKLLTDGGVVDNFPVDIMLQKGVDVIIGVDVQDKLKAQSNLSSAMKILMQIVNFQMYDESLQKKEEIDLYLHPDIKGYTVVSFDKAREIIDSGESVADKQLDYIKELASRQIHRTPGGIYNRPRAANGEFVVSNISIIGSEHYTKEYILGKIRLAKNVPITYKKFYEGIDNLAATGNFKNIQYKFFETENGLELIFNIAEQEIATDLQFSVHYDDLYKTGILVNITSKHAIFNNDVLSVDLVLGDHIRSSIDYFIDNGFHWSYGVKTRYNNFSKSFFESAINQSINVDTETSKVPIKYNDFTSQLFVQTEFNRDFALRLGVEQKYLRIFYERQVNNRTYNNFLDNTNYIGAFSNIILDTYDDKYFPTKGLYLGADFTTYFSASRYISKFDPFSQLKGRLSGALSIGNFTTQIISEAGVTIGNSNRIFDFLLGGNNQNFINNFIGFYGYDIAGLSAKSFLKSSVNFRYEFIRHNYVTLTANAARAENDLFNQGKIFENTKTGYALGYAMKSIIGPIEVNYSWSPDTKQRYWLFNVGFWF